MGYHQHRWLMTGSGGSGPRAGPGDLEAGRLREGAGKASWVIRGRRRQCWAAGLEGRRADRGVKVRKRGDC